METCRSQEDSVMEKSRYVFFFFFNQIITTIDLEALKFNSFLVKQFYETQSYSDIVHLSVKTQFHPGINWIRGYLCNISID